VPFNFQLSDLTLFSLPVPLQVRTECTSAFRPLSFGKHDGPRADPSSGDFAATGCGKLQKLIKNFCWTVQEVRAQPISG
jgi:hypothetical protein